jgi:hypothetical protein
MAPFKTMKYFHVTTSNMEVSDRRERKYNTLNNHPLTPNEGKISRLQLQISLWLVGW